MFVPPPLRPLFIKAITCRWVRSPSNVSITPRQHLSELTCFLRTKVMASERHGQEKRSPHFDGIDLNELMNLDGLFEDAFVFSQLVFPNLIYTGVLNKLVNAYMCRKQEKAYSDGRRL